MQESIVFLLRVQCRRKESSRSLSHLLMSFLLSLVTTKQHHTKELAQQTDDILKHFCETRAPRSGAMPPGIIPVLKLKNPSKFPLSIKLNYHSLRHSAIPTRFIRPAFTILSLWDVAYCPSCLFSLLLILTAKVFVFVIRCMEMNSAWTYNGNYADVTG